MTTFQKNKKSYLLAIIFLVLIIAWTAFIFSMSLQTASESSAVSRGLLKKMLTYIQGVLWFDIEFQTLHNLFRKLAHFTEFFILGILSVSFIKSVKSRPIYSLIYCLSAACTDETIQYFTGEGRSAQISDVMLDFSGSFLAVLIFYIIWYIIYRIKKKRIKE